MDARIEALLSAYHAGRLGGETMPEDKNPGLSPGCSENYMYFTLPMALNYQRNSYVLWQCANKMYQDHPEVFNANSVCRMQEPELKEILVQYKVALQPNKQPIIWRTLCETIQNDLDNDIRNLLRQNHNSAGEVKTYISINKKKYPYLGGNKICNYWLYVMERYTDLQFVDRENITVAPDTHVIQSSVKLGIITEQEANSSNVQQITAERWDTLLAGSGLMPIDIHTPLWLWSHGKFSVEI